MYELIIIDIKDNDYTLALSDGTVINKNILFYNVKPSIGSKIYMSKEILKEINVFQYGKLYKYNNISEKEIIKVLIHEKEYYLQRYYG